MKDKERYMKLYILIARKFSHFIGFIFVDNTNLGEIYLHRESVLIKDTITNAQSGINLWESYLKIARGAISPEKSFVYMISFKFLANGSYKYKSIELIAEILLVRTEYNIRELL